MEFVKELVELVRLIEGFADKGGPEKAAEIAEREFKKNFEKRRQGFFTEDKWSDLSSKTKKYRKFKGRPILTQTGNLADSITKEAAGSGRAVVHSDTAYSAVHNEGLRAGRGKGFKMPKRQFMDQSDFLDALTLRTLEAALGDAVRRGLGASG